MTLDRLQGSEADSNFVGWPERVWRPARIQTARRNTDNQHCFNTSISIATQRLINSSSAYHRPRFLSSRLVTISTDSRLGRRLNCQDASGLRDPRWWGCQEQEAIYGRSKTPTTQ